MRERSMRTVGVAGVLGLLAIMCAVSPASAGWTWCQSDPVVRLNGHAVQLLVAIPEPYVALVTGPVEVTVKTPAGVSQVLVGTDAGFNGYGEQVTFGELPGTVSADGTFVASIRVRVPIDATRLAAGELVPVQLTILTAAGATQMVSGHHRATAV